jgi:hypothetical protein
MVCDTSQAHTLQLKIPNKMLRLWIVKIHNEKRTNLDPKNAVNSCNQAMTIFKRNFYKNMKNNRQQKMLTVLQITEKM